MTPHEPNDSVSPSTHLTDVGHLGSAVGHHVINAFTAIVSNVEMLRLRPAPLTIEELYGLIDDIVGTSVAASGVARRLIDYTRPLTTPASCTVRLNEVVTIFAEARRATLPEGIHFHVELEAGPIHFPAQVNHLVNMIENLVINSIESRTSPEMVITLKTRIDHRGWYVLEVIDDGPGMTQDVLKHAIEPFYTTKPGRPGVGLSIANGIWRRHRGTMSIQSAVGVGTTIRLCVEPPRAGRPGSVVV